MQNKHQTGSSDAELPADNDALKQIVHYESIAKNTNATRSERTEAYTQLGNLQLSLRDLIEAEENLRKAIELQPNTVAAHYLLGFTYSVQQKWQQAIEQLQPALRKDPNSSEISRVLGWSLFFSGSEAEGMERLSKAIELAPNNIRARNDLAGCLIKLKRFDEAIQTLRETLGISAEDSQAKEYIKVAEQFKQEFQRHSHPKKVSRKQSNDKLANQKYDEVEGLFSGEMLKAGYSPERIKNAKRMWRSITDRRRPTVRKPAAWASAIEYSIARLEFIEEIDLTTIHERYGVNRQTVLDKFKQVCNELGV